jgi:hypothetical protein
MEQDPDQYPPEEADRRAVELAQRLLNTPPSSLSDLRPGGSIGFILES